MEGLRQSARGTTGKIIIVIAVVAFVFLGFIAVIGNVSFGSIKVNGEKVTPVELNMATNSIKNVYRQMGISDEQANQIALGELVNSKAFSTTIDKMGVIASNDLIEAKIKEDPNFAVNGEFDVDVFQNTLSSNFITVEQYKGFSSEAINKEQFQQGAFATEIVTAKDAAMLFALENQVRTYQSMTIKQADFIDQVEAPTEEAIQLYYDANRTDFMTQESSVVDYISVDANELVGEISVSEDEITQAYDVYVEEQNAKATKTVSHILVSTQERSSDEALEIANEAIEMIQSGESFAAVVTKYSDDFASKDIGGYFGEVSADSVGDIDFKLGASALTEVGEVSAPVQTQFGYHVIRLDALNELEVLSLEDKTADLTQALTAEKFDDELKTQVEDINNARFEVDTFDQLATQYSVEVQSGITVFRAGGDNITSNVDFKNAAFSEQNREEELISEAITSIDGSIVLVNISEYLPQQVKPLDEINGEIVDILVKQSASELASNKASEVVEMYKNASVETLALEGFEDSLSITRNDANVSNVIKTSLFDMPKSSSVVSVQTVAQGSDQVVIVLTNVENAEVDMDSDEFSAYKQSLESSAGNSGLRSFQAYVVDNADVSGI